MSGSIMALGCPQRPLLLKEPDENQILPSDDISWQQEVLYLLLNPLKASTLIISSILPLTHV